jgi:predicted transcriptional regulator
MGRCTKVHGVIDKIAADKAVEEAEMNCLRAAREAHYQYEKVIMKPFVELSEKLIPALEDKLIAYIGDILTTIHKEIRLEQFLVAGSWSSAMIAKVLSEWDHCNYLKEIGFNQFNLVANDIDVYYGPYSEDPSIWN